MPTGKASRNLVYRPISMLKTWPDAEDLPLDGAQQAPASDDFNGRDGQGDDDHSGPDSTDGEGPEQS